VEPSGTVQACNGIALSLLLPRVRLSKLLRMLWGICVLVGIVLGGGPNSAVCVATCYGLDGPGIEFRWGRDIPDPFKPTPRAVQPYVQWVPATFPGDKAAGGGVGYRVPLPGVVLTIHPL
jgi:hypothetical protein